MNHPIRKSEATSLRLKTLAAALIAIALCLAMPRTSVANHAETQELRVAVAIDEVKFAIVARRGAYRAQMEQGKIYDLAVDRVFYIELKDNGVEMNDGKGRRLAHGRRGLLLRPLDRGNASLQLLPIAPGESWTAEQLQTASHYRASVEFAINRRGQLTAVNHVGLEEYLYGVVGVEIGKDAPLEAMKAQAIAGRSEALAKIHRGMVDDSPLFDFVDSPMVQAYHGKGAETPQVRRAVDETRGQILTWEGDPIDAVYSHSCGGVVAVSTDLWPGKEVLYAQRKWDSLKHDTLHLEDELQAGFALSNPHQTFCNPQQPGFPRYARNHFRWSETLTASELNEAVAAEGHAVGRVRALKVTERAKSGRVRKLRITGEKGQVTLDRELEIRDALGGVKSTFFVVGAKVGDGGFVESVRVNGGGYGHGVGMCQMGTYMMARRGARAGQILKHYFPNAQLALMPQRGAMTTTPGVTAAGGR